MDRDVALEARVQAWVDELRELWAAAGLSMGQFATQAPIDKGTISRYLSGKRVPRDSWFLDQLLAILADNGKPVTPDVREHLTQLQLRALEAVDPSAYKVRLLQDQLAIADTGRREAEHHAGGLEEQLAERNREIDKLTGRQHGLWAAWRPRLAVAAPFLAEICVALIVFIGQLLTITTGRPGVRQSYSPPPVSSEPSLSNELVCVTGSLQFIGSTAFGPIVREAADAYMQACPGAAITVTGGDSDYGLARLLDAVSSDPSSAGSIIAMYDGYSSDTAGLSTYPLGVLVFAVVAHAGLFPTGNITTSELRKIFVAPGEQGLVAVGRRAGDGSRKALLEGVFGLGSVPVSAKSCPPPSGSTACTVDSTAALLNFVNGTPNAIGYAEAFSPSAGFPQVSVLSINNVRPTPENVLNGSYDFWTTENLYAAKYPTPLAKEFLSFLPHFIDSNPPSGFIACSNALKRLQTDC